MSLFGYSKKAHLKIKFYL